MTLLSLGLVTYYHLKTNRLLDNASQEWIAFDTLSKQNNEEASALYHLTNASSMLEKMNHRLFPLGSIPKLKNQLDNNITKHLTQAFIPSLLKDIEQVLTDPQQPYDARYRALQIYLMLGIPKHYQANTVATWFQERWQKDSKQIETAKKLELLKTTFKPPFKPAPLNQQIVNDTRNYLNALPISYLHYSLAKSYFPVDKKSIEIKGFNLANTTVPYYFTKEGFRNIIIRLPTIAKQLSNESWVLDKQSPYNLQELLEQAYSYDYALWWKNFIQKSMPLRVQNYQDAIHLTQLLRQSDSINKLTTYIQEQTSPELNASSPVFNQQVASQFTDLNLISESAVHPLIHTLNEMEKFLTTISIVNDEGKTAFSITKSRFQNVNASNPLSLFFNQVEQLPEPIATWARQIANDTCFILLNDTKQYINSQWKKTVYQDYINTISKRFPFDTSQSKEVAITDFNHFFSTHGLLNTFIDQYIK